MEKTKGYLSAKQWADDKKLTVYLPAIGVRV